jgi:tetratricopeptide (TPR) repeat protein
MSRRWFTLAVALAFVAGCAKERACDDAQASGTPIDPVLMSFIGSARAAHHLADGREDGGDAAGAESALRALLDGPLPPKPDAAEVREVLADTRARLADLESRRGDFDAALRSIDAGLALVPEASYFRGHLFETRGLVEERRTKALTAAGDLPGAGKARERALAAFEEAMRIQQAVIRGAGGAKK